MRVLVILGFLVAGCEKTNPNVCCTDEADCAAAGLEAVRPCADGKACRGNVCVEETCGPAGDCNLSAPYCKDGTCSEMCDGDAQCPGFSQEAEQHFCVNGACEFRKL